MKSILTLATLFLISNFSLKAQDTTVTTTVYTTDDWERNNLNLRIGPEVGFPVGDFGKTHNLGIGASALLDIPLARRWSLIFYAAAKTFGGKNDLKRATVYPLRTGINYKLTKNFYATGQIGESIVKYNVSKTSVSQGLGVGYFNGALDFGARWDHEYAHGGLSTINLHAKYVITLGLKDR